MPNWASTEYVIRGSEEDIQKLYSTMQNLEQLPAPKVKNGWGIRWLGCLVAELGKDPGKVFCRGEWSNLFLTAKDTIRFSTESAWDRCEEVEDILLENFPSLNIYYLVEELGNGVFYTNDRDGEFFEDTYIIDYEDDGMCYYNEKDFLKRMSEIAGTKIMSFTYAQHIADLINERQDEYGSEGHIYLHQAEIE